MLGEPGVWRPADDILAHTPKGMETIVRLGEPVARSLRTEASPTHSSLSVHYPE